MNFLGGSLFETLKAVVFYVRMLYHTYLDRLVEYVRVRQYQSCLKIESLSQHCDYRYTFNRDAVFPFTRLSDFVVLPPISKKRMLYIRENVENMGTLADEITLDDMICFCGFPSSTESIRLTCFNLFKMYITETYVIDENTSYKVSKKKKIL